MAKLVGHKDIEGDLSQLQALSTDPSATVAKPDVAMRSKYCHIMPSPDIVRPLTFGSTVKTTSFLAAVSFYLEGKNPTGNYNNLSTGDFTLILSLL